jgi:hypothetical protein
VGYWDIGGFRGYGFFKGVRKGGGSAFFWGKGSGVPLFQQEKVKYLHLR